MEQNTKLENQGPKEKSAALFKRLTFFVAAIALGLLLSFLLPDFHSRVLKMIVAALALVILLTDWAFARFTRKSIQHITTFLLIALAVTCLYREYEPKMRGVMVTRIHTWSVFHYVLGTKYFDQTGYLICTKQWCWQTVKGKNTFPRLRKPGTCDPTNSSQKKRRSGRQRPRIFGVGFQISNGKSLKKMSILFYESYHRLPGPDPYETWGTTLRPPG